MTIIFSENAWEDTLFWQKADKRILKRINAEHRLIYKVTEDSILIAQIKYHY
jgi:toxin YoeB